MTYQGPETRRIIVDVGHSCLGLMNIRTVISVVGGEHVYANVTHIFLPRHRLRIVRQCHTIQCHVAVMYLPRRVV